MLAVRELWGNRSKWGDGKCSSVWDHAIFNSFFSRSRIQNSLSLIRPVRNSEMTDPSRLHFPWRGCCILGQLSHMAKVPVCPWGQGTSLNYPLYQNLMLLALNLLWWHFQQAGFAAIAVLSTSTSLKLLTIRFAHATFVFVISTKYVWILAKSMGIRSFMCTHQLHHLLAAFGDVVFDI